MLFIYAVDVVYYGLFMLFKYAVYIVYMGV